MLHVQDRRNESDKKYVFTTSSKIKVEAKGLGTQTRGLRHGSTRPDLFILDDIESDESTSTPEKIAKAKAWFNDRSEERRVGKEGRARWGGEPGKERRDRED